MKIELIDEFTSERSLKINLTKVEDKSVLVLESLYDDEREFVVEVDYEKFISGLTLLEKNI